eukprot:jgi/Mesvir1/15818/Mv03374-RA.1
MNPVPDAPDSPTSPAAADVESTAPQEPVKTEEVSKAVKYKKGAQLSEEQKQALRDKMRPYHQKRNEERAKKRQEEREAEITKRKVLEKELELQRQRLVELELEEKRNKFRIERLLAAEEVAETPTDTPRPRRGKKPKYEVEQEEREQAAKPKAPPPAVKTAPTLTPYEQRMLAIRASLLASLNDD